MQPGQPDPAEAPEPAPGPWSTPPPQQSHPGYHQPPPPRADPPQPPPVVLEGEILPPAPQAEAQSGPRQPPRYRQEPYYPPPEPEYVAPQAGPATGQAFVEEEFTSNLGTSIAMFALFPAFAVPATINARRAALAHRYGADELAEDNAAESRKWTRLAMIFGFISWTFLICCGGGSLVLRGCGLAG
jgi:hypothetical protein